MSVAADAIVEIAYGNADPAVVEGPNFVELVAVGVLLGDDVGAVTLVSLYRNQFFTFL